MKKIVLLLILILFASSCGTAESVELDCEKAKEASTKGALLLDVRSEAEYNRSHLLEAKNIEVSVLEKQVEELIPDKKQEIIVYCQSGTRSKQAMEILQKLGYTNVKNLTGGISSC